MDLFIETKMLIERIQLSVKKNSSITGHLYLLIFLAFIVIIPIEGNGQSNQKIEKQAMANFDKGNYVKARDLFIKLSDSNWNENNTSFFLAQCYLKLHQPEKAFELLTNVSEPNEEIKLLSILSSVYSENFDEALELLENFKNTQAESPEVEELVSSVLEHYEKKKGFIVQNLGDNINSPDREYSAVMYNDYNKLLFTSRKEQSSSTADDGLAFETIYSTQIDTINNWEKAKPFDLEIEKEKIHDATVQIYGSGEKMILYRDGKLYKTELLNGNWTRVEDLPLHNYNASDTHCFISSDEKTVFFASDYLSGGLNLDLFYATKDTLGQWTEPVPLAVFNTEFDEDAPFLANDSTFYFSSRGHNSIGGYDIFKSTYNHEKKQWNTPENLGFPINTVAEDTYYSTDGQLSYLSSTRRGGYGSLDLYRVFLFNKVKIEGVLLDDLKQPIRDAIIHVNYDSTTLTSYSDDQGHYEMFAPLNEKMEVKIIKDSLNIFEGDYIVNIFMKDANNNEFNFYIDSSNPNKNNETSNVLNHINIDVKNDLKNNPIISSVDKESEEAWATKINNTNIEKRKLELAKREFFTVKRKKNGSDMSSDNFKIYNANIIAKEIIEEVNKDNKDTVDEKAEDAYVVQLLTLASKKLPDNRFFKDLDLKSIKKRKGKDGLSRFYVSISLTKKRALEAMKDLRKIGYHDAFVRKLSRYDEL